MPVIALRYFQKKILVVNVDVRCKGKSLPDPIPFIVDTAAERTFIVPVWEKYIIKHLGQPQFNTEGRPATTLVGPVRFRLAAGIQLYAKCTDGQSICLNNDNAVCFARRRLRATRAVKVNLLGRDILNAWALYHNPSTGVKFLARGPHPIDGLLSKSPDPDLQSYCIRPPLKPIDPGDIIWLD